MAAQQQMIHRPVVALANGLLNAPPSLGNGRGISGMQSLQRQSSIYSLTLDEFQNTLGQEPGKPFGSMNMDEFMRNIWTAEEGQALGALAVQPSQPSEQGSGLARQNSLQKQGSLALPNTLGQKTVEEVWRDIHHSSPVQASGNAQATKQSTLGSMTLEDFLVRAGIPGISSRDDIEQNQVPSSSFLPYNGSGHGHSLASQGGINQVTFDALQSQQQQQTDWFNFQLKSATAALAQQQQQQMIQQVEYQLKPLQIPGNQGVLPAVPVGPLALSRVLDQSGTASTRGDLSSLGHLNGTSGALVPVSGVNGAMVAIEDGARGKKRAFDAPVEKTVERRQKRMIKNRESAARSRARKQQYTVELEAEVNILKEENERLRIEKAAEAEKRKEEMLEKLKPLIEKQQLPQNCPPLPRLRRTRTGPW
eukprot:TRINITY_DN17279_c0_g1_i1.p1 TRINITY_DN17279_c0_g1~~TRINITY_DN17279_c0_g1_i1.p1  ORF type:complete len:476 (+),score=119.69 TRINITY_DN17279_c0_g1_i1:167-1429(+)